MKTVKLSYDSKNKSLRLAELHDGRRTCTHWCMGVIFRESEGSKILFPFDRDGMISVPFFAHSRDTLDIDLGHAFAVRGVVSDAEKVVCTCPHCRAVFCDPSYGELSEDCFSGDVYCEETHRLCPACHREVYITEIFRRSAVTDLLRCSCEDPSVTAESIADRPDDTYVEGYIEKDGEKDRYGLLMECSVLCPTCGGKSYATARMLLTDTLTGRARDTVYGLLRDREVE